MREAFAGIHPAYVVSVSPYIYHRSVQSPIFKGIPQTTVLNGINTDVFHIYEDNPIKNCFQEKSVVLYVSAYFDPTDVDKKGGAYLVELARRFETENVVFVVVGPCVEQKADIPDNLIKVGHVQGQQMLAKYYCAADITVNQQTGNI